MKRSSENLCGLCRQFDFDSLGLKHKDFKLQHDLEKTSEIESFNPDMSHIERRAQICVICREVFGFYNQWRSQNNAFLDPNHDTEGDSAHIFIDALPLRSNDPESNVMLVRMFVHLAIKKSRLPDSLQGYYRPLLQFQKWIPERSAEGNGESAVEHPYNGRKRAAQVSQTQLLGWKKDCDDNHGNSCKSNTNALQHLDFIRLIDVQQRCVTVIKGGDLANLEYAALSYVWGNTDALGGLRMPKLMVLGENREEALRQPGALTPEKVLRTIDDAMTFVDEGLKLTYLWVDCLCILQVGDDNISDKDTKADQKKFIDAMDSIYACASVTIVAAAGDNANTGLPGINSQHVPERIEQNLLQIQKRDKLPVSLVRTLDLEGSDEEEYFDYRYVGGSSWDTRGWTFQEKIFSRRTFIFTKMQVYWECQTATWCEDSIWETSEPLFYRHCFNANEFRLPWNNLDGGEFEGKYRKLVEEYTGRKLTQASDGLDAFTGILNALGEGTDDLKQEFKWGLPLSFLANALKWRCHPYKPVEIVLERRTKEHLISIDLSCPFPSWSWVGWVGKVEMGSSLNEEMVDLHFYYLDDIAKKLVKPKCRSRRLDSMIQHIRKLGDRIEVHINDREVQKALPKSFASNILFFWSSAARFRIRVGPTPVINNTNLIYSREISRDNHIDVSVHTLFHVPLLPSESTHAEYELVVIGKLDPWDMGRPPTNEEMARCKDQLAVLVCFENGNEGVVYRKGLVHISIMDWKRCKPEWKLICLG